MHRRENIENILVSVIRQLTSDLRNERREIMNNQTFVDKERQYGANNYKPLPVVLTRGEGIWAWDTEGKKYLDMLAGYSAVNQGHCHPRIVAAAQAQINRLTLTSRAFHNDQLGPFAEKLALLTGFDRVLPMNTGAEAVESALKIARKWGEKVKGIAKDRCKIITCANNFHGRTIGIISFSTVEQYRDGFGPLTPGFVGVPHGDIQAMAQAIDADTCALLVEPIQGEGGVIIPPDGYLRQLRQLADDNNILLIFDEIQVGLGRTGKMFAFEHENVRPDVLILAKALSGGICPISVVLAGEEVMGVLNPGDHGSTFGGNPLACAVACAALDVLIEEKLPENAAVVGAYFVEKLRQIKSPAIKEIRARGLMIGVEINPEYGNGRIYCDRLLEKGLLCKETHISTIRFTPPLIITKEEIDWALEQIVSVF